MLKGKWVRIPPTKIIPDFAPDGKAYLFVLKSYDPHANDYDEKIVCFVRPNGGMMTVRRRPGLGRAAATSQSCAAARPGS